MFYSYISSLQEYRK